MYSTPSRNHVVPSDFTTIWRYMTFTKLLAMLNEEALFFCRLDQLNDRWEGVFPREMLKYWANSLGIAFQSKKPSSLKEWFTKRIIPTHFISCWYISDYESDAMWRLYTNHDDGIAIKSTIGALKKTLELSQERVWIGQVKYVDYDRWKPPKASQGEDPSLWLEPFFCKRISFQHENELRALIHKEKLKENLSGINVNVQLNKLMDSVYVFPDSSNWFLNLVKDVLDKYGLGDMKVKRSSLGEKPWR